jgi:hypothetical protein
MALSATERTGNKTPSDEIYEPRFLVRRQLSVVDVARCSGNYAPQRHHASP